jgi:hypothetical protein
MLHEALKSHLEADTQFAAGFYYLVVPQSTPLQQRMPCVVFSRNGVQRQVRYCATDGMVLSSITLDCYATTYTAARSLAAVVRSSLIDFRGQLGGSLAVSAASLVNEIDLVDIEPGLFRVSQTWDIWHVEEE